MKNINIDNSQAIKMSFLREAIEEIPKYYKYCAMYLDSCTSNSRKRMRIEICRTFGKEKCKIYKRSQRFIKKYENL